jgi:hypothetical protein
MYPNVKMSTPIVDLWKILFRELKEIRDSADRTSVEKNEIHVLRKQMNTSEIVQNRSMRSNLLSRAVAILQRQIAIYEEHQQSGTYDEMAVLDGEIQRLSDLVESAEEWIVKLEK